MPRSPLSWKIHGKIRAWTNRYRFGQSMMHCTSSTQPNFHLQKVDGSLVNFTYRLYNRHRRPGTLLTRMMENWLRGLCAVVVIGKVNYFIKYRIFQTRRLPGILYGDWLLSICLEIFFHCKHWEQEISSAKNFVKSDLQAVRQEFIFVKCRSSLVCSSIIRSSLFCWSFFFTFTNISDPILVVREKFSQEINLVKKIDLTKATKLNSWRKFLAIQ